MIGYLDTSAFVPIMLAAEATSPACVEFWLTADMVVSTRLLHVETASALARASGTVVSSVTSTIVRSPGSCASSRRSS